MIKCLSHLGNGQIHSTNLTATLVSVVSTSDSSDLAFLMSLLPWKHYRPRHASCTHYKLATRLPDRLTSNLNTSHQPYAHLHQNHNFYIHLTSNLQDINMKHTHNTHHMYTLTPDKTTRSVGSGDYETSQCVLLTTFL